MSRSSIITDRMASAGLRIHPPVHPGEILKEEFLAPLGIDNEALATALNVPPALIADLLDERRPVSPDLSLRLARYFATSAEFWLSMQMSYDLQIAEAEMATEISAIEPLMREDAA